jgi:hypothetical protein
MPPRLRPTAISQIRARLAHARSPASAGRSGLHSALARDACSLSAHCADVEASRDVFSSVSFAGGASYFRDREGAWGFEDADLKGGRVGCSRIEAVRGARSFGPERDREYAPLDDATLAAIAARAKELIETTTMSTRAALTKALVADLPALLAHAAALDDDAAVLHTAYFKGFEVGELTRDVETGAYEYGIDMSDNFGRGKGLDFDEALRRALFVAALPEEPTDEPEWLRVDRADASERKRVEHEEWERQRAEEARVKEEEERVAAAAREVERQRLKVTMDHWHRADWTRTFRVSQGNLDAIVRLIPCQNGDTGKAPPWSARIQDSRENVAAKASGDSAADVLHAVVDALLADERDETRFRELPWAAALEAIEGFGPFRGAGENWAALWEHERSMRELSAKVAPDLVRVLAEHGLEVESVSANDPDGEAQIVVHLKVAFPR